MAWLSMDSKFMQFVDRLTDVFLLNLLWLVCSLPLVTLGAATAAVSRATLALVADEDEPVVRLFFRAFRANFWRATRLWLVQAAALYALWIDWQLALGTDDPSVLVLIVSFVSTAFVAFASLYAYPLLARFDSGVFRTLENSLQLCSRYFGRTALLAAVLGLEVALFLWNPVLMIVGVLIGPVVVIYTIAGFVHAYARELRAA